jgi:serine protease Do
MPAAPKMSDDSQRTAKALSQAYASVAEFVRPSVVQISVTKKMTAMPGMGNRRFQVPQVPGGNGNMNPKDFEEMLKKFFGPQFGNPENQQFGPPRGGATGIGSGFVYDDHGHILTNTHVVADSDKISVTFYDGTELPAKVVGADKDSDVAVIKIDSSNFPALPRGDSSKLHVGEMVMAFGSPFQLSQTVTQGIISALERNNVGINAYESFIQTDAPINRGNSGGPLVNMNGEVIGINSAIMSGSSGNDGVGFAIPIDMASSVADMLIKDGKVRRARIGIRLAPLNAVMARQLGVDESTKGILIEDVLAGSPAEKAGLKQGDVITGVSGQPIQSLAAFRLKVAASEVSKPFELNYIREGKKATTSITPSPADKVVFEQERESEEPKAAQPEKTALTDFGIEVEALTPEVSKPLGLPEDLKGLVVTSVKEGSDAQEKGISDGTVITKVVNDKKIQAVTSVKEFQALASKTNELTMVIQNGKNASRFVTVTKAAK